MINETERFEIKSRIKEIVKRLDNLCMPDIICNVYDDHVMVSIDAHRINYLVNNARSLQVWLNYVNVEIYSETCYTLRYDYNKSKVYLEMEEADYAGSDDLVSDFVITAETVLNIVDTNLGVGGSL